MKKIKFKKVDTWSLYYTLAPVILKGLKKFPEVFPPHVPRCL